MALRKILTDRDPVLHKTSRPVTNFDDRLHDLLDDLKETLANAAAPALRLPRWEFCAAASLWWTRMMRCWNWSIPR